MAETLDVRDKRTITRLARINSRGQNVGKWLRAAGDNAQQPRLKEDKRKTKRKGTAGLGYMYDLVS